MASRRNKTTKIKEAKAWKRDRNDLKVSDALCPICRGILMEPVSLPCDHVFCSECLEKTMRNSNLACPLCRTRIGSWLRRAKKESRLVDVELWMAIKERFPQQIRNKMNGIEEDLQDGPEVIVSFPGEIRKEYELEKKKIDEELRKKQEADMKANEELIKKIKQEEEYQKIVMEEKIKLDEAVARKLAEELKQEPPSTSAKKLGPLDKFLEKSPSATKPPLIQPMDNFANKDYTCTVLRLDNKKHPDITLKSISPIMKKKMQQIQKVLELENTSDSSDCFESEMRYFKPIDYKMNPPSHGSSPIKISPMKPPKNGIIQILSPGGQMNFNSNILESAFARISLLLPYESQDTKCETPQRTNKLKRTLSDDLTESPRKIIKEEKSTTNLEKENPIKKLFKSPRKKFQSPEKRRNGDVLEQEKMDFELARKLHNELNQVHHLRRKRQSTLDGLVKGSLKLN